MLRSSNQDQDPIMPGPVQTHSKTPSLPQRPFNQNRTDNGVEGQGQRESLYYRWGTKGTKGDSLNDMSMQKITSKDRN